MLTPFLHRLPCSRGDLSTTTLLWLYRSRRNASTKDLRHAAALLIAAAGVKLPPTLNVTAEVPTNTSTDSASIQYLSGLRFLGQPNVPALKELARVYEAGMFSHDECSLLLTGLLIVHISVCIMQQIPPGGGLMPFVGYGSASSTRFQLRQDTACMVHSYLRQTVSACCSLAHHLHQPLTCHSPGEGVAVDAAIAHDLFKRAAELGDPDAQADMAVRYSLGLQPTSGNAPMLYELTPPNIPEALLNYFFGAAGNDTFAQMALGFRHMYGVDVPQSCQAGLLYYNRVAEQVVEAARYPGSLPQVVYSMSQVLMQAATIAHEHISRFQKATVKMAEAASTAVPMPSCLQVANFAK